MDSYSILRGECPRMPGETGRWGRRPSSAAPCSRRLPDVKAEKMGYQGQWVWTLPPDDDGGNGQSMPLLDTWQPLGDEQAGNPHGYATSAKAAKPAENGNLGGSTSVMEEPKGCQANEQLAAFDEVHTQQQLTPPRDTKAAKFPNKGGSDTSRGPTATCPGCGGGMANERDFCGTCTAVKMGGGTWASA